MKLSIITPSYNQGKYIEQCILSIIRQDYENMEYFIIDGGSFDNTIDIIKKYETSISYWVSEKDKGQTHAINKGLRKTTGEIIAYLCADDFYEPNIFNYIVNEFVSHPGIDMIYGGCTFVNSKNKILRQKKAETFSAKKLLIKNIIWQPTVFIRNKVFDKIGYFNEELNYAMDYEFWLRVSKHNFNIKSVNKNLAYYRWHANSKTVKDESVHLKEAYNILNKYGGGGIYSWFLHTLYWKNTSKIKRMVFKLFAKPVRGNFLK